MLFHDGGYRFGETEFTSHFSPDLAVFDSMGCGLAKVMKECPASHQFQIDVLTGSVSDLKGLAGHRQAVLNIRIGHAGVTEQGDIRLRDAIQPVVCVGIDTDTGQWVTDAVFSFIHQFLTAFANA